MRKFTVSFNTDSDSTKSTQSSQAVNESGIDHELPKITTLQILLTDIRKWTTLRVIGDAILLDIKYKLVKMFGPLLEDPQNMGLFQPTIDGKLGKFLEEERLLSEYTGGKNHMNLEFIRKRRLLHKAGSVTFVTESFPKDVYKAFLRYVGRGDHKKVASILEKGFDPNFQCPKTGETPLTLAVQRPKSYSMISALVSGGAHRDFCSKSGLTALHKAASAGNFEAVKSLLDFGQSPNTLDEDGLTPLYHNILNDPDTKICHSLLYEHSMLGVCDKEGLQEIHLAARYNRVEQINLLIMYGADVNSRCTEARNYSKTNARLPTASTPGDTPLHVAAAAGQRNAVMRLLSWGADPSLVNKSSYNAIQVATRCGHGELAEAIRLYHGSSHSADSPFLPAPTYNPRRRMRRPPANSYITEPTPLSTSYAILQASTPDYSTTQPPGPTDPIKLHSLHRTVSTGDIDHVSTDWGFRHWDERTDLTNPELIEQGMDKCCKPFTFASSPTRTINANLTLDRKSTLLTKSHASIVASTSPRQSVMSEEADQQTRHFSRLTRHNPAGDVSPTTGEFQREGSQTDSGISNSSIEKQHHAVPPERSPPVVVDSRTHAAQEHPDPVTLTEIPQGKNSAIICPSASLIDGIHWNLPQRATFPTSTSTGRMQQIPRHLPRTVVLQKAPNQQTQDSSSSCSFGLSLRTAKSPVLIANFNPTVGKPSLQTVIHVVRDMPAYNAGIRDGDFVLKINGIDVTRFSHDDVVKCLSASSACDTVCLTVIRTGATRSMSRPSRNKSGTELNSTKVTPAIPPHTELGNMTMNRFSRCSKPLDDSGLSSARSSERTNYSNIPDVNNFNRSIDESSANASSRKSSIHMSDYASETSRPNSGHKYETRFSRVGQLRKSAIPRSRTISGISENANPNDLNQLACSLYFARNPRFHRIGSQDSRSSMSSTGEAAQTERKPVQLSATKSNNPGVHYSPKVTLIRAEKNRPPQTVTDGTPQQQLRVYPAHRTRHTSMSSRADTDRNYLTDAIILPPPAQFR